MSSTTQAEREFQYMPDFADQFQRLLLAQDRSKTNWRAVARAIGDAMQLVENDVFDLPLSMTLNSATDAALDKVGAMVDEPRMGLDDEAYRRFIRAKILVNMSEGTPEELLTIFRAITGSDDCRHFDMFPGGFTLVTIRQTPMTDAEMRRVRRMMTAAKAAGVAMELIEALPGYFGFEGDPDSTGFEIGPFARIIE